MQVGTAKRSYGDDAHCGDQVGYWQKDQRTTLCIVDGLGHGQGAEIVARAAIDYVKSHLFLPLPEIFKGCNRAIRKTYGAAMGIAVIDEEEETLTYAGIGNTRIQIIRNPHSDSLGSDDDYLISTYGIVGGGFRKLMPKTVLFGSGDLAVLTTDGVKTSMDPAAYDAVLKKNVQQLAEQIIKDWSRETDDAAALTCRFNI